MKHIYYKSGVNITKDKSMFNFLHDHFMYDTMNSWNRLQSVANNVKIYNLQLSGDDGKALAALDDEDVQQAILGMLCQFTEKHPGYTVAFNGRMGGYLVLYNRDDNDNVLPHYITDRDYEEYKQYCKDYQGSVKNNRYELVKYTKLVQSFDLLCDEIRNLMDDLSNSYDISETDEIE